MNVNKHYTQQKRITMNIIKKILSASIKSFEKIAIIRTRQALSFLSDTELKELGITRHSLENGNFYHATSVKDFPIKHKQENVSTKSNSKAA